MLIDESPPVAFSISFFPVDELAWVISPDPMFGIILGIIIGIPCFAIMMIAMRDAGEEIRDYSFGSPEFLCFTTHINPSKYVSNKIKRDDLVQIIPFPIISRF